MTHEIEFPQGVREKFILKQAARDVPHAVMAKKWQKQYPDDEPLTPDEIISTIREYYDYYVLVQGEERKYKPPMPAPVRVIEEIDFWIQEAIELNKMELIPRLLQIKANVVVKDQEVAVKMKRPFIEVALKIYQHLLEQPEMTHAIAQRELGAAIERLELPVSVEDVLVGGAS